VNDGLVADPLSVTVPPPHPLLAKPTHQRRHTAFPLERGNSLRTTIQKSTLINPLFIVGAYVGQNQKFNVSL